jgi:hypothetical protein
MPEPFILKVLLLANTAARFFEMMENCLTEKRVPWPERALLDGRCFYATRNQIGKCTSGLVRNVMAAFLREHAGGDRFLKQQWCRMVVLVGENSSALGFFVRQVLFSIIEKEGMVMRGVKVPGIVTVKFGTLPQLAEDASRSPVLYIPNAWNYAAIDAVIIAVDVVGGKKVLEIMPVQITINDRHGDSEADFFRQWDEFLATVGESSFDEVRPIFLWIVEDPATFPRKDEMVPSKTRSTRNARYTSPPYERKVRSVKEVSEKVGNKLEMARKRAEKIRRS